ncbi:MAG TPA: hypothetical protein VGE63_03425 [Candidatus Paceibacterota bacterium]
MNTIPKVYNLSAYIGFISTDGVPQPVSPMASFMLRDAASEKTLQLVDHYHDLYQLFLREFAELGYDTISSAERETRLQKILEQIFEVRRMLEAESIQA